MNLFIIGAGGHGKVVADISIKLNKFKNIAFLDDEKKIGSSIMKLKVEGKVDYDFIKSLNLEDNLFFVAIGNCEIRKKILNKLLSLKINIPILIHPNSSISKSSSIGIGTLVCAGAVIGPDSRIGKGAILNHLSVVDHDCNVGNYTHISPHSSISGNVRFGELSFLGPGARVVQGKKIGTNCIIGAGAVVLSDIPNNKTALGVPAKF